MVEPGASEAHKSTLKTWLKSWYPLPIFVAAMLAACVIPWAFAACAGVAVESGVRQVFESKHKPAPPSKSEGGGPSIASSAPIAPGQASAWPCCAPKAAPTPSAPKRFLGFVEGNSNYVYFAALFFLWLHVCAPHTRDDRQHPCDKGRTLGAAVLVCAVWMGHNTARNLWLNGDDRVIVSYVNLDISKLSWGYQLFLSLLMCLPVVRSWQVSRMRRSAVREKINNWVTWAQDVELQFDDTQDSPPAGATTTNPSKNAMANKPLIRALLFELQNHAVFVGTLFDAWQAHSLLLAGAFLPWTAHYWSTGPVFNDHRYYWSTLTVHIMWGLTWYFLSAPLFIAARRFNLHRSAITTALVVARDASAEHAGKTAPISTVRLALVGAASVVTFAAPLLGLK